MSSRHARRKRAKEKRIYLEQCAKERAFYEERDALVRANLSRKITVEERAWRKVSSCASFWSHGNPSQPDSPDKKWYNAKDAARIAGSPKKLASDGKWYSRVIK